MPMKMASSCITLCPSAIDSWTIAGVLVSAATALASIGLSIVAVAYAILQYQTGKPKGWRKARPEVKVYFSPLLGELSVQLINDGTDAMRRLTSKEIYLENDRGREMLSAFIDKWKGCIANQCLFLNNPEKMLLNLNPGWYLNCKETEKYVVNQFKNAKTVTKYSSEDMDSEAKNTLEHYQRIKALEERMGVRSGLELSTDMDTLEGKENVLGPMDPAIRLLVWSSVSIDNTSWPKWYVLEHFLASYKKLRIIYVDVYGREQELNADIDFKSALCAYKKQFEPKIPRPVEVNIQ